MAHAPALPAPFTSAEQPIAEHTSLEQATREVIHLAVATVNDCGYCQAASTIAWTHAGLSEEQTVKIRRGEADFDPALDALPAVVRDAAEHKGHVADDTWQRALDAGWSDRQLLEAFADTVRTILTNYFNHYVGTELDLPPAPTWTRRSRTTSCPAVAPAARLQRSSQQMPDCRVSYNYEHFVAHVGGVPRPVPAGPQTACPPPARWRPT